MDTFNLNIGGEWRTAETGARFEALCPVSGRPWASVARASADDARLAVKMAWMAWQDWRNATGFQRARLLRRLADLIDQHQDDLAQAETRGNGKTITETRAQMAGLSGYIHYYAGLADKLEGKVIPVEDPHAHVTAQWEPLGVCVLILPWNSPLPLTIQKLAPALAAGNCVVVKPSEFSSTSVMGLMELLHAAGFPPGVVNVITGFGHEIGEALIAADETALVSFTGGVAGGSSVAATAGRALKRVMLELGGKSPQIVFADSDLDDVVHGIAQGIFASTGQSCIAGSRLLIEDSIHDELVDRLVAVAAGLRIGDPWQAETQLGPLANRPHLKRVLDYFDVARQDGATCAAGGRRFAGEGCADGFFVEPTIYTGVDASMRIAQEEIFGPVLSVLRFSDEADALRLANNTRFGLAAGIWTKDGSRAQRLARGLRSGMVWINSYRTWSIAMPFGGVGQSGIGREGGTDMIHDFMQQKSVWMNTRGHFTSAFLGQ